MNRKDFQTLSSVRLNEARALLTAGFPEGAYYLAGYAVECALKACIAKRTQEHDFPDKKLVDKSYTHDLDKLIDAAELSDFLKQAKAGNRRLEMEWEHVRGWSEQSRYVLLAGSIDERRKAAFLMIFAIENESGRGSAMAPAVLVSYDIEMGQRVVDALDREGFPPEVALWAMLPQYENWRFVLSSSRIHGYEELIGHLRDAGVLPGARPGVLLLEESDPFIQELREKYAGQEEILGHRLGSQYLGKQYLDEAYIYRIQ